MAIQKNPINFFINGRLVHGLNEPEEIVGQVHLGQIEEGTKDGEIEKRATEVCTRQIYLQVLIEGVCSYCAIVTEQLTDKSQHNGICVSRKALVQLGRKCCTVPVRS